MAAKLKCPSFYALPGSQLLGRVGEDGTVGIMSEPIVVTDAFLSELRNRHIEPEIAFRFAGGCHQFKCKQWQDESCGLINRLVSSNTNTTQSTAQIDCGIRSACRWFHQKGLQACLICSRVTRTAATELAE